MPKNRKRLYRNFWSHYTSVCNSPSISGIMQQEKQWLAPCGSHFSWTELRLVALMHKLFCSCLSSFLWSNIVQGSRWRAHIRAVILWRSSANALRLQRSCRKIFASNALCNEKLLYHLRMTLADTSWIRINQATIVALLSGRYQLHYSNVAYSVTGSWAEEG